MRHLGPAFSAARMVGEYAERFYLPAADHHRAMVADGYAKARSLAAWKARVRDAWGEVSVVSVQNGGADEVAVGSQLAVEALVRLGTLEPGDVKVEAYSGTLTAEGQLGSGQATPLAWVGRKDEAHVYRGAVTCDISGARGYAVRVLPAQDGVLIPHELALVTWE